MVSSPLLQLAYCVVQFLEKDATLTEHVSPAFARGRGQAAGQGSWPP